MYIFTQVVTSPSGFQSFVKIQIFFCLVLLSIYMSDFL